MSSTSSPYVSVVVPCFNEEGNIPVLYQRLKEVLAPYAAQGTEIILVDDGSKDSTWQILSDLGAKDKSVVALKLSRNFGHQHALSCALDHCKGQRILVIDADLQDPPELLPDMMARMDEGYEVVYGHRIARRGETMFKRLSAWMFYRVLNHFSEVPIPTDVGDFRLMSRKALNALLQMPERVRFTRGMVSWLGFKQSALDYHRAARYSGHTHYSLYSMICFATEGLTSFSPHPLRLAIWLGVLLAIVGSLMIGCALLVWLFLGVTYPITTVIGIFLVFQAVQWIMLGIISSYLGVILRESKHRPLYLVDESVNR